MLDAGRVGRIVAVFDWEMSALGDPLVDLGIVLAYWSPTAPPEQRDALTHGDRAAGLLHARRDRRALRRALGPRRLGIRYYEIFAVFKIAVVIQQIYVRYVRGQTTDARFANFGARVEYLARHAAQLAEHA